MVAVAVAAESAPALTIGYTRTKADALLADDRVLAAISFDDGQAANVDDPRHVRVPLQVLAGSAPLETWRVDGRVRAGRDGDLAWAEGGGYLLLSMRIAEGDVGGIEAAASRVYARLMRALAEHGHPHLLRAWNYLADINTGTGDDERYRRFSIGRAAGIGALPAERFPAATAIGRTDGVRELAVYLLAGRCPGQPVENPRQVSAYRYPRQYGPVPPSFARAMRLTPETAGGVQPMLLISGTASVVGHASAHDQAQAQIEETLRNLDSLSLAAGVGPRLPMERSWLKAYLRDPADAAAIQRACAAAGLPADRLLCLHGDICRTDLLVEIDGLAIGTE